MARKNPKGPKMGEWQKYVPATQHEARSWLGLLSREVNTYALFLRTWSAMGYAIEREAIEAIMGFQKKLLEAMGYLGRTEEDKSVKKNRAFLNAIEELSALEEIAYGVLMKEINRLSEETKEIFPMLKLKFEPCF